MAIIPEIEIKYKKIGRIGYFWIEKILIGFYIVGGCCLILSRKEIDFSIQIKNKVKNWRYTIYK